MKKFKLTEKTTKEVVASLDVSDFNFKGIKENLDIINSWVKDMSQNHVHFTLSNPNHIKSTSDSTDWNAYFYDEEIFVEHINHALKISEVEEEMDFDELKDFFNRKAVL